MAGTDQALSNPCHICLKPNNLVSYLFLLFHFTDEETEAQRGTVTCPNVTQLEVVEPRLESWLVGLQRPTFLPLVLLLPSQSLLVV